MSRHTDENWERSTRCRISGAHSTHLLRRYRLGSFVAGAAEDALTISSLQASTFLRQLRSLGLIESAEFLPVGVEEAFEITTSGLAFANASAAAPIHRKTAELVLRQFLERLHAVNDNPDYVYRVESAVLFGSMLSTTERLGDVDMAIELQPKVSAETEFREWCDQRGRIAQAAAP